MTGCQLVCGTVSEKARAGQPSRAVCFHYKKAGGIRNLFHTMKSGCKKRTVSPGRVAVLQGQWLLLRSLICSADLKHSGCWLMSSSLCKHYGWLNIKKVVNLVIHGKSSNGDEIFICCISYVVSAFTYSFNLGTSWLVNVNEFDLLFWQIQVLYGFNVYRFKTDFLSTLTPCIQKGTTFQLFKRHRTFHSSKS